MVLRYVCPIWQIRKSFKNLIKNKVCGVWGLESTEEQMHNEAVMLKTGFSFKKTHREEKELLVDKMRGGNISENFFKKISWEL